MASASTCLLVSRMILRSAKYQPAWMTQLHLPYCTAKQQTGTSADGSAPPPPPPQQSAEPPAGGEQVEQMQKQLNQLTEQVKDLEDKYKRSLAERENIRARLEKQIQDARQFGIQSFCKDLLDVADILGKATESVPPEEITDKNPHLKSLFEGLKMTEAQLLAVFKRHGVSQINPLGERFDPNQHEALFEQAVEGHQPGHVCLVTKLGYRLHERTIRPALVGVAKAPPN